MVHQAAARAGGGAGAGPNQAASGAPGLCGRLPVRELRGERQRVRAANDSRQKRAAQHAAVEMCTEEEQQEKQQEEQQEAQQEDDEDADRQEQGQDEEE